MELIDNVIRMLSDGLWHNRDELRKELNLSMIKLMHILNFLAEYDFIELRGVGKVDEPLKAKLQPIVLTFCREIR